MASNEEFGADIDAVREAVERNRQEVLAKIAELEAAVAQGGQPSQDVLNKFAALKASVEAADADV